ncbi:hypothetical protein BJX65DRAFT_279528 [Aspergillus insuetus]
MAPLIGTLYHHPYSICSIMVRQTIAIRGEAIDADSEAHITEQVVEIFKEEQFSEHFLTEINPLGQVPVLVSDALEKPIADSLEITHYLAQRYPSLIPASHKKKITDLLHDLHALNYFSLSFPGREHVAEGLKQCVFKRLAGDISPRYRDALTFKLGVLDRDKVGGLKPGVTESMSKQARALMERFAGLITWPLARGEDSPSWLFDLPHPTALDYHLAVFIARMLDVGRDDIIPDKLREYAALVWETAEWKAVMQGRKTMIAKK